MHNDPMSESASAVDAAAQAATWRAPMLRFARLHLQPREEAQDVVQDTLLAWLQTPAATQAQSNPRRYLFGILKHKITDRLRSKYRGDVSYQDAFDDDLDQVLFDARGHWQAGVAPAPWSSPEGHLQDRQFFAVVDLCVSRLPAKPARVFSMKELLECEATEVCDLLGLTKADYWQCMSRARKQLQLCLHQNWFESEKASP